MSLLDLQVSFGGLTVGCGTPWELESVEGLDDFDVRSNDQILPSLWGSQAGGDFVNARDSIIVGVVMATSDAQWATLENAWLPSPQHAPTQMGTLAFKFADRPELQTSARLRRRARARTDDTEQPGGLVAWYFQFSTPDPRLYSAAESSTVATSYVADNSALNLTSGSGVNLAFDLTLSSGTDLAFDFTGVAGVGGIAVNNAGNVDTYPSFTFATTAAMATWHVINDTTGETASFAYALVPGHTIVADMAGVATGATTPPVTIDGASDYPIWQSPRIPIRLVPGLNFLRFFVDSGTAAGSTCTVSWRDAWL